MTGLVRNHDTQPQFFCIIFIPVYGFQQKNHLSINVLAIRGAALEI